jgi:hypothetical protein
VVYVGPNQEDELSILGNLAGSAKYDEFVKGLGWRVDLSTHVGFAGGLEPSMTVDGHARYWCSSTTELVLHESVNLTADPDDPRLVKKKKHIGNDPVHVIWNEHYREYRPSTISGDFGNVIIVITPLSECHLYRVNLYRDSDVPLVGPLYDGALIPRSLLAPLVRTTCINATRTISAKHHRSLYRHPYSGRASEISSTIRRHAMGRWSAEQFLGYVIFANTPLPEEMAAVHSKSPPPQPIASTVVPKPSSSPLGTESIADAGENLEKSLIEQIDNVVLDDDGRGPSVESDEDPSQAFTKPSDTS